MTKLRILLSTLLLVVHVSAIPHQNLPSKKNLFDEVREKNVKTNVDVKNDFDIVHALLERVPLIDGSVLINFE